MFNILFRKAHQDLGKVGDAGWWEMLRKFEIFSITHDSDFCMVDGRLERSTQVKRARYKELRTLEQVGVVKIFKKFKAIEAIGNRSIDSLMKLIHPRTGINCNRAVINLKSS